MKIQDKLVNCFFISISVIFFIMPLCLQAETSRLPTVTLEEGFNKQNLLGKMIYLEDKNKIFTIADVESSLDNNFTNWSSIGEKEISFGFTNSAYWLYFQLKNNANVHLITYLECYLATMDHVELFYKNKDGLVVSEKLGDLHPFEQRKVKFRTLVFKIPTDIGEEKNIFLRLENKGPMKVSFILRSPENFSDYLSSDHVVIGIYYGMMIVIAIYNLFLYFSIRDTAYLFYILYIINIASYQFFISGNAAQFLLPKSPDLANQAPNLIANFSFFSGLLFTKFFLNTKTFAPFLNRIIEGFILVTFFYMILIIIVGHDMLLMKTSNLLGLVLILLIISTAIVVYKKGYRPARFFLLGWSILLLAVLVQILANLGALNLTAENVGQIGSGIEAILLSFALGDRIKRIKEQTREQPENLPREEPLTSQNQKKNIQRPVFVILQKEYNLTYQQAQVCIALMEGKSRTRIAQELNISSNTLKKHLSEIYNKTINRSEKRSIPSQEKLQKLTILLHELDQIKK